MKNEVNFIPVFSIPVKRKKVKQVTFEFTLGTRKAIVEHYSRGEWEGYFDDDHSTSYHASTKRELIEDMSN